ncbi:MAG: hypothetical protein J7485_02035 [Sphingobium sp.]|nr:hypothetical protein [Sphingobium sp.]
MWKWRLLLLATATVLWFGSMVADPFTAWGVEHEQLRPSVARLSAQFAVASLILIVAAGLAAYWKRGRRRGWSEIAFGVALLFFGGTALVRLIWISLHVIA